ncbi:E3 ubiquitin ligase BIG BROTHER-related-like [Salvia hispanica]|uniref:E3 ubiquitin ligase BIG BROTHER-related-like n=1 Tax=Salvia hispanica TaxID=49212 RepID=UPI002009097A|nr:E3 ubiquitin ligase BIG BROTHER-related-like [Salvia hispanica]
MPQVKKEHKRCSEKQQQNSFAATNGAESRIPSKKKVFMFVKLKGLGCKAVETTPAIIRSAAEWEAKGARNQKRKPLHNRRNLDNVVVDLPHVNMCCTPPGIGIASDVAPRAAPHRKHSREARRNDVDVDVDAAAEFPVGIGSRTTYRSSEEIIEMLMNRQALLPGRILRQHDRYQHWRLDVDDMSYEELLNLGDRIGYVGTGLQEAEISNCLKKFKHINKDWECSICQERCKVDDEIGILKCGHHHHMECIKQWLLQKNACPVCKSAALSK